MVWINVIYQTRDSFSSEYIKHPPPGGGGLLNKVTGRLRSEVQPLTLLYTISPEKVPLLYTISPEKVPLLFTFYWEKVPLSHTYLRTMYLLSKLLKWS